MIATTSTGNSVNAGQTGTASERTRATMTAYLDALLNGGDFGQYLSENVTLTIMDTAETSRGREAVVGLIDYLHNVAFAATPEFGPPIVDGERGAIEATFIATHVGEFAGIAPTNRQVRLPYAVAYELADGWFTAVRIYLPMDALVRQLRDA